MGTSMKRFCWAALCAVLSAGGWAQNKPSPPPTLPVGSVLRVSFFDSLKVEDAKVGEPVRARILGLVQGAKTLPPREPMSLVGHITEIAVRTDDKSESRLGIAFDKLEIGGVTTAPRELATAAVINKVIKVEHSAVKSTPVPTSGDDPVQRAAGPVVDSSGRPVYSNPGITAPGPAGASTLETPVKDLTLHADDQTGVTLITCKKRNIVLDSEVSMYVRITSSGK